MMRSGKVVGVRMLLGSGSLFVDCVGMLHVAYDRGSTEAPYSPPPRNKC